MSTSAIEHVIVVMLENRSYDNVLGGLYMSANAPPYNQAPAGQANLNGLTGTEWNVNPSASGEYYTVANQVKPTQSGGKGPSYPPTTIPLTDPGETFADMAWQILGAEQGFTQPYESWVPDPSPQPPPPAPTTPPTTTYQMSGFTKNYQNLASPPPDTNFLDVMNYFSPAQVPVTAWLAYHFAVCDQWYGSAPTQTFCNRAFSHCAAPSVAEDSSGNYSLIDDAQYGSATLVDLPSIFSQLDNAYPESIDGSPPNWKVYFHDYSITMLTVPYVMQAALSSGNVNVATYDKSDWGDATPQPITALDPQDNPFQPTQTPLGAVPPTFLNDVRNEKLPMYSVIEPRYSNTIAANSCPPNSNHPGGAGYLGSTADGDPPIDVADGEAFLQNVYNVLSQSKYWSNTLLIITYDEHGGLYDHVPPPPAHPPGSTLSEPHIPIPLVAHDFAPADGFKFNVLGCRVPTIVVSPYIKAGTQISPPKSTPFDHTSIIKTVQDCFLVKRKGTKHPTVFSLTKRDENAPSLHPFLDFSINNSPGTYPG